MDRDGNGRRDRPRRDLARWLGRPPPAARSRAGQTTITVALGEVTAAVDVEVVP